MKKLIIALIGASCLITGCTAAAGGAGNMGYRQVNSSEAMEIMKNEENYIILDVRRKIEYKSGHIPGAVCVPNETIGTKPISELPDKEQLILVYCRSGRRSKQASEKLVKMGYTNIVEFGGINEWQGETVKGAE